MSHKIDDIMNDLLNEAEITQPVLNDKEILNEKPDDDDEIVEEEVELTEGDDCDDCDDEIVEEEVELNLDPQSNETSKVTLDTFENGGNDKVLESFFNEAQLQIEEKLLSEDSPLLEMSQEKLLEYQTSIIRINKKEKIERLRKKMCFVLAKQANDPLYTKYAKLMKQKKILRAKIESKYMSKAKSYVTKYLSGRGIEEKDVPNKNPNAKSQ